MLGWSGMNGFPKAVDSFGQRFSFRSSRSRRFRARNDCRILDFVGIICYYTVHFSAGQFSENGIHLAINFFDVSDHIFGDGLAAQEAILQRAVKFAVAGDNFLDTLSKSG